jgi:hypothetical protein
MVYEETKGDIDPFLKLYKLAKRKGIGVRHVVDALNIANNDLPALERRFKRMRNDITMLQSQKRIDERNLYQLNNQIASTTKLLNSFRISSKRERREIQSLCNKKQRLEALVSDFKNSNEDYVEIEQTAEENVKSVLTNGKLLLRFATASVIESLSGNPELCNFVLNDFSNEITSGSNYLSLMLSGRQQRQQQSFSDDIYSALILEEAEKIYNKLTTELTNRFITTAAAAAIKESSLLLTVTNNRQNDTYKIEEPRYNNQS